MRRILVAVLTLATACVAMAGEWNFITTTGKGKDVEAVAYDRDAIVTLDEGINVWFAWVNSNPSLKHDLLLMLTANRKDLNFSNSPLTFEASIWNQSVKKMLGITPSQGPWEKLWLFFLVEKSKLM